MPQRPNSSLRASAIGCAALAALSVTAAQPAPARPNYTSAWLAAYPGSASLDNVLFGTGQSCQLCHDETNGGDSWNAYGWELRTHTEAGASIAQALGLVEPDDSDVDPTASTNLEEIDADTQPGWTDGANNTIYFDDGSTLPGQLPPGIDGDLDPTGGLAVAYCFGDDLGTPCPCSNASVPGAGEGCANSSGVGGRVDASGSNSAANDDLVLDAVQLLANQPALLFVGTTSLNGGDGFVFGDGLRCAGVGVVRLGVDVPDGGGNASWGPGLGALGGWAAGDARFFQAWYRNPGGPCGSGFNLSNGLEVVFAP